MPSLSLVRPVHRAVEALPPELENALAGLRTHLAVYPAVLVAYSGGVDSALVAAIAAEQLGDRALAVTGVSPALAPHLLDEARLQAHWMGIRHREIPTAELEDPAYSSNPADRCYACKRELHGLLALVARETLAPGAPPPQVLDGVNRDDLGDHRPGIQAARELERQGYDVTVLNSLPKFYDWNAISLSWIF